MPQRYFIKLAYDGTQYHGWQQQQNAMSIQHIVSAALQTILRHNIKLTGCGRTDAGVHAKEYYAHFDSEITFPSEKKICGNLNGLLPADIVVFDFIKVKPEANARYDALTRTYKYFISAVPDPFNRNFEYYFARELDSNLMNEACNLLKKYSNFACFSKSHTQVKNHNCTIYETFWKTEGYKYIFTITANRFLRNMVRAIVGTMIDVGLHKISIEDFRNIIENGKRSDAGMSVPAKGLFLTSVTFPEEIFFRT
ncbi:MAG: tRNA pseudouridine(38-40) synthase TruA [Bacteroidales bacterium]|jgi:tRNA pseudouridine38-40 synthase|nr:tRNA pseudouridine(38-40) synthase TruA [Bacteroidales bacterium]MDD4214382.1 tRNA pseudouridine(38-40) synthase TruA [Bacteroidales bacterium]